MKRKTLWIAGLVLVTCLVVGIYLGGELSETKKMAATVKVLEERAEVTGIVLRNESVVNIPS